MIQGGSLLNDLSIWATEGDNGVFQGSTAGSSDLPLRGAHHASLRTVLHEALEGVERHLHQVFGNRERELLEEIKRLQEENSRYRKLFTAAPTASFGAESPSLEARDALHGAQQVHADPFSLHSVMQFRPSLGLNPANLIPSWFDPKDDGLCGVAVPRQRAEHCGDDGPPGPPLCGNSADYQRQGGPLSPIGKLQLSLNHTIVPEDDEEESNLPFQGLLSTRPGGVHSKPIDDDSFHLGDPQASSTLISSQHTSSGEVLNI